MFQRLLFRVGDIGSLMILESVLIMIIQDILSMSSVNSSIPSAPFGGADHLVVQASINSLEIVNLFIDWYLLQAKGRNNLKKRVLEQNL